jgi:oxygen-independent coproporphyrinogen-3 oxidase
MRSRIVARFKQAGYRPSPCGWWSKSGVYPDGNIPKVSKSKWQNYNTMLAYGPGAYGWLTGGGANAVQTHNITDIHAYRTAIIGGEIPLASGKKLTGYAALATRLGFALKANQPISQSDFKKRFGVNLFNDDICGPVLNELVAKGLLVRSDRDHVRFTEDGETLHEEIISTYIHERIGGIGGGICQRAVVNHA